MHADGPAARGAGCLREGRSNKVWRVCGQIRLPFVFACVQATACMAAGKIEGRARARENAPAPWPLGRLLAICEMGPRRQPKQIERCVAACGCGGFTRKGKAARRPLRDPMHTHTMHTKWAATPAPHARHARSDEAAHPHPPCPSSPLHACQPLTPLSALLLLRAKPAACKCS